MIICGGYILTKAELLKICKYDDSRVSEIMTAHPKQIIISQVNIPIWKVTYKYKTKRGNLKQGVKYLVKKEEYWDGVEYEFTSYIERFNKENANRQLLNVEILNTEYLGELVLEID